VAGFFRSQNDGGVSRTGGAGAGAGAGAEAAGFPFLVGVRVAVSWCASNSDLLFLIASDAGVNSAVLNHGKARQHVRKPANPYRLPVLLTGHFHDRHNRKYLDECHFGLNKFNDKSFRSVRERHAIIYECLPGFPYSRPPRVLSFKSAARWAGRRNGKPPTNARRIIQ
jgi:hypothetical protein